MFKAERQDLYHMDLFLWWQFRLKKSVWVEWKIVGLFVNLLCAENKCSLRNRDNFKQHFQMQLSQKGKLVSEFFFTFSKFRFNLEHFFKKMTLIADVFSEAIISEMKNIFCFFYSFSKFIFNFEHFRKKDDPHGWCIFELMDSKKGG